MSEILLDGNIYDGEYVSYPAPTMDYVVVTIGDTCLFGRTLESEESKLDYVDRMMKVDSIPVIILTRDISFEEAVANANRLLSAFEGLRWKKSVEKSPMPDSWKRRNR